MLVGEGLQRRNQLREADDLGCTPADEGFQSVSQVDTAEYDTREALVDEHGHHRHPAGCCTMT